MSNERLATLLGRAVMDAKFATKLSRNPAAAAKSMGILLSGKEVTALREVSAPKLTEVASGLRGKLGARAIFDQQQQQQARMD